jgi:hypothetical protein
MQLKLLQWSVLTDPIHQLQPIQIDEGGSRGHRGRMPDPPVVPTRSWAGSRHHQKETASHWWCLQIVIAIIVVTTVATAIAAERQRRFLLPRP